MPTLGLDIGGTRIKAAVLEGQTVSSTFITDRYSRPDRKTLLAAVRQAVEGSGFGEYALEKLSGVGISIPGVLNEARTRVVLSANVPGLSDIELVELWQPLAPTGQVTTDQIATAVDYAATRAIRGRLLSVAIGTGVGAAVLDCSDAHPLGVPLRVNGDSPGHLGQIDVSLDDDPPIGPDGGAGGVEAYLGAAAMKDQNPFDLSMDDVPTRALVRLLRICHALYRPDHIALLGGIGIRLEHLAEPIVRQVNERLTRLARPNWQLGFGTDDFHAARGAARLASQPPGTP